jgi:hypothetical protein
MPMLPGPAKRTPSGAASDDHQVAADVLRADAIRRQGHHGAGDRQTQPCKPFSIHGAIVTHTPPAAIEPRAASTIATPVRRAMLVAATSAA